MQWNFFIQSNTDDDDEDKRFPENAGVADWCVLLLAVGQQETNTHVHFACMLM